jgi:hypothetical protein
MIVIPSGGEPVDVFDRKVDLGSARDDGSGKDEPAIQKAPKVAAGRRKAPALGDRGLPSLDKLGMTAHYLMARSF